MLVNINLWVVNSVTIVTLLLVIDNANHKKVDQPPGLTQFYKISGFKLLVSFDMGQGYYG